MTTVTDFELISENLKKHELQRFGASDQIARQITAVRESFIQLVSTDPESNEMIESIHERARDMLSVDYISDARRTKAQCTFRLCLCPPNHSKHGYGFQIAAVYTEGNIIFKLYDFKNERFYEKSLFENPDDLCHFLIQEFIKYAEEPFYANYRNSEALHRFINEWD